MRISLVLGLLSLGMTAAHAGRPLVTEDAGLLDPGDCEWETVAGQVRTSGTPRLDAWSTQAGCGIGHATQLAASYGQARSEGATDSNLFVGGKTRLLGDDEERPSLALAYGVALLRQLPVDNRFRFDSAFANLALSAPLAEGWTSHLNLGAAYHRDADVTRASWAVAVEHELGDLFGWGVEAYGEQADRPWLGAGARWDASTSLNLNASVAVQRGRPQARLLSVGAKFAF